MCVFSPLYLFSTFGAGTKSVIIDWELGKLRLEVSLYMGDIRLVQVFVNRCFFSVYCFISRFVQRLENLGIGQEPLCVVYCNSSWIRSLRIRGWAIFGEYEK
ncbi:hypothetical protein Hanom_Chr17g01565631 [Helianthus anomalus]